LSRCLQLLFWLPSTIGRILSLALFLIQFLEICYKDEFGIFLNKLINGNNKLINFEEFPLNVYFEDNFLFKFLFKEITC